MFAILSTTASMTKRNSVLKYCNNYFWRECERSRVQENHDPPSKITKNSISLPSERAVWDKKSIPVPPMTKAAMAGTADACTVVIKSPFSSTPQNPNPLTPPSSAPMHSYKAQNVKTNHETKQFIPLDLQIHAQGQSHTATHSLSK